MTPTTLEAWLKTRPPSIQKLAREFPIPMVVQVNGRELMLCGYNEDDLLVFWPAGVPFNEDDTETRVYICASHLRSL